jgi:RNA polymerase sigma-70 factor, ECF subfamily
MNLPDVRHPPDPASVGGEDAEIVAEIARGNLGRFDLLVDRYKARLMGYLGHRVPDRHHAEDLVQETFLRLFRAARNGGYSGRASVATWLFTIGDNCATDHLRAAGRRRLTLETDAAGRNDAAESVLDSCPSPDVDPVETAARRESQDRAEALLALLPEEQHRVVALKVFGGLTLAEVAEVVGCPVGTVASRLFYGLRKIEASLACSARRDHGL